MLNVILLIVAFVMAVWAAAVAGGAVDFGTFGVLLSGALAAYFLAVLLPPLINETNNRRGVPRTTA